MLHKDDFKNKMNFKIFFYVIKYSYVHIQVFRLLGEEGFFVGASSGLNVAAAVKVAKKLGPGHTIVTCLCDTGQVRYTESNSHLSKSAFNCKHQNIFDSSILAWFYNNSGVKKIIG